MADTPDVLKRLEEIEGDVEAASVYIEEGDALRLREGARYLLRLTRALLESQRELIGALRFKSDRCEMCASIIARAEKVRKGEPARSERLGCGRDHGGGRWNANCPDCEAKAKLPLGHEYAGPEDGRDCKVTTDFSPEGKCWLRCGQPRSAHEPR